MKAFDLVSIASLEAAGAITGIQDGNHGEIHPKSADYVESGIPFIMARDIQDGRVNLDDASRISEAQASKLRIGFSKEGDVLLTHKGTIGNVAIVGAVDPYVMLTPQVTYYRVDETKLSRNYLALAFRETEFQKRMKSLAEQSTRPYIGITAQRTLQIVWVPLDVQKRIAAIVSVYDDLIENNRRRIALLEEAARQLYKEWFVRFRFPGHEHVKIVDGVPEGWERKALGDVANVVMGQSPKSQFYNQDGNGFPFHQGVTDYGFRFVTHRTYSTAVTKLAEPNDILVSVRAPVGRINITLDRIVLGRGLSAVRSNTNKPSFLLYALKLHFYAEDIIGTGAIYAATNKKELGSQLILIPSEVFVTAFEDAVAPIDRQIANLSKSADHLARARDFLLPKLMSGVVTV